MHWKNNNGWPMQRILLALALALSVGTGAVAQQIAFSPELLAACLSKAQRQIQKEDCIGTGAMACKAATRDATPGDIAACMAAETEWWSLRMQSTLRRLEQKAAAIDAVVDPSKPGGFRLVDDLAAMQAAWEHWREKTCAFEAMLRRGTPYTSTAAASCMMKLTAQQSLFLDASLAYRTVQEGN